MKSKIIALALAVAMLALAAIGSSLAYFTDSEEVDNVFTVGSVDIDLIESTLDRENTMDEDPDNDGDVNSDEDIIADAEEYEDYLAEQGENIVPGRIIMKNPYVVNNGRSAAYVRIRVIVDADLLESLKITLNNDATADGSVISDITVDDTTGLATASFIYTEALAPAGEDGDMTYWSPIAKFFIPTDITQDDIADYQDIENIITVQADAIQAETFASAVEAFAAFDAQ